jgi:hypothetical protein
VGEEAGERVKWKGRCDRRWGLEEQRREVYISCSRTHLVESKNDKQLKRLGRT